MVRSFRLILLNNYVIFFLWLALFGECADDLVDCGHPFHICGKDEDYYTDSCSENDIQVSVLFTSVVDLVHNHDLAFIRLMARQDMINL